MQRWDDSEAPGPTTHELLVMLTLAVVSIAVVLSIWFTPAAEGQTLTIGAGEIRSGQHHRQDAVEVEALWLMDHALVSANASFRHGADDNDNRPWPPFMHVTAGPRLGPLALVAGWQSYPWDTGRWTPLAGPRLDISLGPRVRLHISNLWRRDGLVQQRMGRWTPATRFRLDLRLWTGS